MKIIVKDREPFELADQFYVNHDGWFGETWLIESPFSNAISNQFVVEAEHETDVIDILLDSKYGHLFLVSSDELSAYQEEFRKSLQDEDEEFNWEEFSEWLESTKDIAYGGNEGKAYHSDAFLIGCLNRCKVEEFNCKEIAQ